MKNNIDFFTKKFRDMPKEIDLLCMGTTNCHFAYDFREADINAFNMGIFKNAFYNPFLLEKYKRRIRTNALILVMIEYPFFLCDFRNPHLEEENIQYAKVLFGMDPKVTVWRQLLYRFFPYYYIKKPLFQGFIKNSVRNAVANQMDIGEVIHYSKYIITQGWEKETRFPWILNYSDGKLTKIEHARMQENIAHVEELIRQIRGHGWRPVLIGASYSKEFNELVPEKFRQDCFYDCVSQIQNDMDVLFLDYSSGTEFDALDYYLDVWNLNEVGRVRFTNTVLKDLEDNDMLEGLRWKNN